ncbi:hypothetical protein OIU93_19045 [Paeniglutamicibacter sp. ZC-3]|uniref:hypothetical protein n=1 Tax=Paeniglutamicibacter sp. ZC-3 TaxID=2986919 RepID=UPI0021F6A6F4|nr:hypothetical protein [Paeniglutamicibacter sp. ZC-3]MCV9996372.1 hypothetical protein [Paeniglutamicibacter sp. ZC-3]
MTPAFSNAAWNLRNNTDPAAGWANHCSDRVFNSRESLRMSPAFQVLCTVAATASNWRAVMPHPLPSTADLNTAATCPSCPSQQVPHHSCPSTTARRLRRCPQREHSMCTRRSRE